jgi:hypothetical protein
MNYDSSSTKFTAALGSYTEANNDTLCGSTSYFGTWAGIGGSNTGNLAQAGTLERWPNTTAYSLFVEVLPNPPVTVSGRFLPGLSCRYASFQGHRWFQFLC